MWSTAASSLVWNARVRVASPGSVPEIEPIAAAKHARTETDQRSDRACDLPA
jgi:hypothetical protein